MLVSIFVLMFLLFKIHVYFINQTLQLKDQFKIFFRESLILHISKIRLHN